VGSIKKKYNEKESGYFFHGLNLEQDKNLLQNKKRCLATLL
jgi:hypothetical protein